MSKKQKMVQQLKAETNKKRIKENIIMTMKIIFILIVVVGVFWYSIIAAKLNYENRYDSA
jgi:cell division septal protein FtsQ